MPVHQLKQSPEVTKLLDRGKRRGVLTYDEINDALGRHEGLDAEQLARTSSEALVDSPTDSPAASPVRRLD